MNEDDLFTALRLIVKICKDVLQNLESGSGRERVGDSSDGRGNEIGGKKEKDKTISCVVVLLPYLLYLRLPHRDIMIKQKGERIGQALGPSIIHF